MRPRARALVRGGRWLLPVACMFVFSTLLAFAATQAYLSDRPTATPPTPAVPSNTSFGMRDSPPDWGGPANCPETVDQADIDFYLLTVSKDLEQLRANAVALCQFAETDPTP